MELTLGEIRKRSGTVVYNRGKSLYESNKVSEFDIEPTEDEILFLTAMVDGSSRKQYYVDAHIDPLSEKGDRIISWSCECMAAQKYSGICKHTVALLLSFVNRHKDKDDVIGQVEFDWIMEQADIGIRQADKTLEEWKQQREKISTKKEKQSSTQVLDMLKEFLQKEKQQFCKEYGTGNIVLEPKLHMDRTGESISLKIGNSKMYVLKDMSQFLDDIKNESMISYGKNLTFTHSLGAFTKESIEIIELLQEISIEEHWKDRYYYYSYSGNERRRARLSRDTFMKLLELYKNREIAVGFDTIKETNICNVVNGNPNLEVVIRVAKNGGADIMLPSLLLLENKTQAYLLYNHTFFHLEEEYYKNLKPALHIMSENMEQVAHGYGGNISKKVKLHLAKKEYAAFATNILPLWKRYMEVSIEGIDFDEYKAKEAKVLFYLDIDKKQAITCRLIAEYGEKTYNLASGDMVEEVGRDTKKEYQAKLLVEKYFENIDRNQSLYYKEYEEEAVFELLDQGVEQFETLGEVYASDSFKRLQIVEAPKVTVGVKVGGNLLDFSWTVGDIDYKELENILASYRKKKRYHRLKSGEYVRLEDSGLEILSELADGLQMGKAALQAGKISIPKYRALYLDSVMRENADKATSYRDSTFKTIIRDMKATEDSSYTLPEELHATLRPYQENGYQWLQTLAGYGFGGILADDMGLGKTLQIIALLTAHKGSHSLIICPASLIYNWESEFAKFSPSMSVIPVLGTVTERKEIIDNYEKYDVLITSYDLLKRDIEVYETCNFAYQVIDEAQYIKNPTTLAAKAVKAVKSTCRFALTGTPIENRLSELWSIFDYLMPGYLYSYAKFKDDFETGIVQSTDQQALSRLQKLIRPFILRRMKKDVLKELPDKIEEVVYAKLTGEQSRIYQANEKQLIATLNKQSDEEFTSDRLQILAALTRLRQICCDPAICYENYGEESAKLDTCIELVDNAVSSGHKVLIFSGFTSMLERIENRLRGIELRTLTLTGQTSKEKRKVLVEQFQGGQADVFLISLKAGGTGLNLTQADIVIHYDPWWNVAAQNQATDRAHRIGQKNTVSVIKLIAKDTIEEKILKLQENKKELADQVISAEGVSLNTVTKKELLAVLES